MSRMEESFTHMARTIGLLIEAMAVVVVAYGALEAFAKLLGVAIRPRVTHGERKSIWRGFGMWLLLGLEFELAADIIGSVFSPEWQEVAKLGAIAVIRTFLNYFLESDLENAEEAPDVDPPPRMPEAATLRQD
jgi:uncharacterized membrane protein